MQVGIDITLINRFEKLLDKHGKRFYNKFLTDDEMLPSMDSRYLAKCWAVKEACIKASDESDFKMFGYAKLGAKPFVKTTVPGLWHLSVADEKDTVIAVVVKI